MIHSAHAKKTFRKPSFRKPSLLPLGSGLLLASLLLAGCNQYAGQWSVSQDPFAPLSAQEASVKMNYAYVKTNILAKYCTTCHGNAGGVNLETTAGVRAHAQDILRDMANRSMPKDNPTAMSDADRAVLYNWVKAGAPEGTAVAAPLYPPLSPDDAAAKLNYAYVQANVLLPMCISCHGNDAGLSLESIDSLRANAGAIESIVAGSKKMPLGFRGPLMTEDQRSVLYNWLVLGAPQGDAPVPPAYPAYPALSDADAAAKLNYNYIRDNILIPKCVACHGSSGHTNLETYAGVLHVPRNIMFVALGVNPSMPPFGAQKPGWNSHTQPIPDAVPPQRVLSDNDKQVLFAWLSAGAPQGGAIIDPPPVQPNFDDINKRIFQVRCMDCHDQSLPRHQIALTQESLLDPGSDYITPGNAATSNLVIALAQTSSDPEDGQAPMPPPKKGYAKLPAAELQAVKDWINSLPPPVKPAPPTPPPALLPAPPPAAAPAVPTPNPNQNPKP